MKQQSSTAALTDEQILLERTQFIAGSCLLLFVGGWIAWFYPFDNLLDRSGTPLGADYAVFYVAGEMVLDGATDQLYDPAENYRRLHDVLPQLRADFALPYRYPPVVALVATPLALVSFPVSYAMFVSASCVAWWLAIAILLRQSRDVPLAWRKILLYVGLAWPVAIEVVLGGQVAMFALLIAVASLALLRQHRYVLAGAVLALAAYKPNVLAVLALGCFIRYPRMLLGFIPAAAAFGLLCMIPAGFDGLLAYVELSRSLAQQIAAVSHKLHGLSPLLAMLSPAHAQAASWLVGATLSLLVGSVLRSPRADRNGQTLWFATLLSCNSLCNAYTPIYDLVLLLASGFLTIEYLAATQPDSLSKHLTRNQLVLGALFFGPHLSQALAPWLGVQLFAVVMIAVVAGQLTLLVRDRLAISPSSDPLRACVSG